SAAVTWENTGTTVAILVTEASAASLKVLLYNFGSAKPVVMRLWRLQEGHYTVRQGRDRDRDDEIDEAAPGSKFTVTERGERLTVTVPGRELSVVEIAQEERSELPFFPRPDVGFSPRDLVVSNIQPDAGELVEITAKVHNIGNEDARDVEVVFYVDGEPIGTRTVGLIEAPNDLRPRAREVQFAWLAVAGTHKISVKVKLAAREITSTNNLVESNIYVH
ncbi:MAG: CARDB domain-containing protein, partial [Candidatus Neomarinimicrobiota bacterium]